MKIGHLTLIFISITLSFCSEFKPEQVVAKEPPGLDQSQIIKKEFQSILDSAEVDGSILIYDSQRGCLLF